MKRLLWILTITLMVVALPLKIDAQVCPRSTTEIQYGEMPTDGFVLGGSRSAMAVTTYGPSTSFLTGFLGDYTADAANRGVWQLRAGYVIPITGKWYSITLGQIGQGFNSSEQYQAEERIGYALTEPTSNWNLYAITGPGVSYETLPANPDEFLAFFKASLGLSASIPVTESWGLWMMGEYGWTPVHEGLVFGIGGSFFIGQ